MTVIAYLSAQSLRALADDERFGCCRMLASRFPFGIYYLETEAETRVVAALDLRG